MKCNQRHCDASADYRYTWPGTDEAGVCERHAGNLQGVAAALGLHLQLIPLGKTDDKREGDND